MRLFLIFATRFGSMSLCCTSVQAVLTNHLPYDSGIEVAAIVLAGLLWTMGDLALERK